MATQIKHIEVPILARVEGEGALSLQIKNNKISQLQLKIYEPPRLFEKFLEGREPNEVIDLVARICGICPVAYQMTAVHAIEAIFSIEPSPWVHAMRRLFYCGEWLESHGLHVHMLAAPDFYGYESGMAMAKDYPEIIQRGLSLHALGNDLMTLLGKRSVNPVGACIGGFYHAPKESEVERLQEKFSQHLNLARELVLWAASLPFPKQQQAFTSVALHHPQEYAMNRGSIVSDAGLDISFAEFDHYFQESQVDYSNALHCHLKGKPYLVGPLARVNLNYQQLPVKAQELMTETKISWPSQNMFHSIVARAIEIYFAVNEALTILENYQLPKRSAAEYTPSSGEACWATEAPRGLLWHRYRLNQQGLVEYSRLVPPTSQNQAQIEEDLYQSLYAFGLDRSDTELRHFSEKVIRNYDPCISCSTHFLTLKVTR